MKQAYVFPGQGAQFSGMGKDLYDSHQAAKSMFEQANDILGFRITDLMFSGTDEDLKQTKVTQPAVFLHSVISGQITKSTNNQVNIDMTAGHSLGEFSALVVSGALSFEDGLRLVQARANAMQRACEMQASTMAAVLGLDDEIVERICNEITDNVQGGVSTAQTAFAPLDMTGDTSHPATSHLASDLVVAANYNCPGQVVISGTVEGVAKACEKLKEAGAKRALPLKVGGAFHSPLMQPAAEELKKAIEQTAFKTPICPIYQNVDALPHTDPEEIKKNLIAQLTAPVRWTQIMRAMKADGMTDFTECGPGNVLTGLFAKI